MATTKEGLVKAKVKEILKDLGAWYCMPMGTGYGHSGIPDFIVCLDGFFLAIETKAGKGTTTALQERELRKIGEAKGIALVVREDDLETLGRDLKMLVRGKG